MTTVLLVLMTIMGVQAMALAAFALVLRRHRERVPARRLAQARRWVPALMDVLMESAAPERLWAKVRVHERAEFVDFLLEYARRVEGRDQALIRLLARPHLSSVAGRLRANSPEARARAVQTLGELDLSGWSDEVVAGLSDPAPVVALTAAATLAREGSIAHLPQVMSRLGRFEGWRPDFLASVLATFGPAGAPGLRGALSDAENPTPMRAAVADALAHLNDAGAAKIAQTVLESTSDPDLGSACLRLLERVGTEEHRPAALAHLNSESFALRLSAARALGRSGGREDHELLRDMILYDPSPWVALNAGRALLEAGGRMALRELAGRDHGRSRVARQALAEAR